MFVFDVSNMGGCQDDSRPTIIAFLEISFCVKKEIITAFFGNYKQRKNNHSGTFSKFQVQKPLRVVQWFVVLHVGPHSRPRRCLAVLK